MTSSLTTMRMRDIHIHERTTSSLLGWGEKDEVALTNSDLEKVDGVIRVYAMLGTRDDLRTLRDRITSYLADETRPFRIEYATDAQWEPFAAAVKALSRSLIRLEYADGTRKTVQMVGHNEERNTITVNDYFEATDSLGRELYSVDLDLLTGILVV